MKRLVIIGASAMGREACRYALECGMDVKGFLDTRYDILSEYEGFPPILGSIENWVPSEKEIYVCACGEPEVRRKYVELLTNVRWATIIHPAAYVGANVTVGEGCVIGPNSTITTDVDIGKHVIVNVNVSISHDCVIRDYVTISPGCSVAGWCTVGTGVFLGVHAVLIPHVMLGGGVFVASGAVVTTSFSSGRVMGVPAKLK